MTKILLTVGLIFLCTLSFSQDNANKQRLSWWREARFGMFIHWGVYAQMEGTYNGHEQAKGGAEWILNRMKVPLAEYKNMAKTFNPVKFDADSWVKMAKDAGMKYIIITAKHHDGFAMFKTSSSKWNIVDATLYKKDILKPLSEACKKYGIRLGFYYSQAQDWLNPGGAVGRKDMREGWPNPDSATIDAYTKEHNGHWDPSQESRSFDAYINEVAVPQVKELLSNYGEISVLWWDTPVGMTDANAIKLQSLLALQPKIITNDRLKSPNFPGDTKTPEQKIPSISDLDGIDWETCMTMNGTWGFRKSDQNWKSPEMLIHNLCDIASKGGNYLLNVGPKSDGTFPDESITRLSEIGNWMKVNGEAIYGTKRSPIDSISWGRCTKKEVDGNTILNFFVFEWPTEGVLRIPGIDNKILSAKILSNNQKLTTSKKGKSIFVNLPLKGIDPYVTVIELKVKGLVKDAFSFGKNLKTGALD